MCAVAGLLAAPQPGLAKDPNTIATGFAVADGSWIVTARHVVQGKPCIAIGFAAADAGSGAPLPTRWEAAQFLAANERLDVAVLHIESKRPPLSLALWSSVPVGLEALVVGYPQPRFLGTTVKVTEGLYSGVPEPFRSLSLFQLSAAVQLGNSGGPVLSPDGLVIGMVRARAEPGAFGKEPADVPQIVNFALNSSALFDFLISTGVNPAQMPVALGTAIRPFETLRRAQQSVLIVAAGDWRGDDHPTIAGQKVKDSLAKGCARG